MQALNLSDIFRQLNPSVRHTISTGFIKGRFIEESNGFIYDVMNYTAIKKVKGLLMFIDFEKAFDSV